MRMATGLPILLALAAAAAAGRAGAQEVVARVKVHNPAAEAMTDVVCRGALPLPADFDGPLASLALRDREKILPTQVSVFSTYPGTDEKHPVGRPEVGQLSARVSLPAGAFKQFDVVRLPVTPAPAEHARPGKALAGWLSGRAPVAVEATDCFGNRYRAEVLSNAHHIETRQAGAILAEEVYQAILEPLGQAQKDRPALQRFLRVRAYLSTYAGEDFASLELMIHNGSIDRPNGDVFYRDIRVGVAEPMELAIWQKRFSPAAGAGQETRDGYTCQACPPAHPQGKLYVMPQGSAGVLRLTVFAAAARKRALAYAERSPIFVPVPDQRLWSWSNPATARYDAVKYPMPLGLGDDALAEVDREVAQTLAGPSLGWDLVYLREKPAPPLRTLGHALPAGVRYGGMTGGAGIFYVFGVPAALTGHNGRIKLHILMADRNFDRQRVHLFYDDGRPYKHGRHVVEIDGTRYLDVPYDNRGFPVIQAEEPACEVQAKHVRDQWLLSAEAERLLKYMNHDDQHLSRVFDAVPASYLACDPVNRDRLVTLGAQACWKLNVYPIRTMRNFGGWGSLWAARQHVDAYPHQGIGASREHGWKTHTLGWAHDLSLDAQIRADCIEVAEADVYVRGKAQMAAGNVTFRAPSSKAFNGEYWFTTGWEEGAILADGARAVVNTLSTPEHAEQAEAMKAIYRKVGRWTVSSAWNENAASPGFHVGLRKKGQQELLDTPVTAGGCAFYMGTPLTWYYELTGERVFLERLKQMAGKEGLPERCRRDLGSWSYALYLAQGGRIPWRAPTVPQH